MGGAVTSSLSFDTASLGKLTLQQRKDLLRSASNEVVGTFFYGQMLKMSRNTALKGEIGHGGRGEEVFGAQLDMEMARLASQKQGFSMSDALYKHLEKGVERDW